MTAKNVKCEDCKFCDIEKRLCKIKALVIAPQSVRNCKVYAENEKEPK